MRTALNFLLTCFISTGALLGATKAANPWPYFAITLIVWFLFAWHVSARCKRSPGKSEQAFRKHMRSKFKL